jgi:hypothetical protein
MADDRFSRPVSGVETLRDRPHEVEYFRAVEAARHGGTGERRQPAPRRPRPGHANPETPPDPAPGDEPRVVGSRLDVRA